MRRQLLVMLAAAFALILVAAGAGLILQSFDEQNTHDNMSSHTSVLESALSIMKNIKNRDYVSLAKWIHPVKGVTFTPYSSVKSGKDVTLKPDDIKNANTNASAYNWGTDAGKGDEISLPITAYFDRYVYDHDYLAAPEIGLNRILKEGNTSENVKTAYPNAQFVDFYFSSFESQYEGMDWASLKLVLEEYQGNWTLVGMIHSCWTP